MVNTPAKFPHRRDRDGLFDSICPRCFATVARSKAEVEMEALESSHICHSSFLADRGQFGEAVATIAAIATTRSLPRTVVSASS